MNKEKQLARLNKSHAKKIKSPLLKTCRQLVIGEGSANADIMIIGEAPGKAEDELGQPFVGSSGKFLDRLLDTIKLKRDDVYITNLVKCRPPHNRDPFPAEITEFWPWLLDQINLIKPKLIITLGRHSLSNFIPKPIISNVHGTVFHVKIKELGKINIYALYHPAAGLYNNDIKTTLIKDFKKIPKILKLINKK